MSLHIVFVVQSLVHTLWQIALADSVLPIAPRGGMFTHGQEHEEH